MMLQQRPNNLTLEEFQACQAARLNSSEHLAERYAFQVVKSVFNEYPSHTDLEKVLLKVAVLNDLYRTFLKAPFSMARHIVGISNFEKRVQKGDVSLVSEISKWTHRASAPEQVYVFATKYCFFSNMEKYFIYDERVAAQVCQLLLLSDASKLLDYSYFSECMNNILSQTSFPLKHDELDMYLWMRGKK